MTKEKLKVLFNKKITEWAETLMRCGVKLKEINRFTEVTNTLPMNDLRRSYKWLDEDMQSKLLAFNHIWKQMSPNAWANLDRINRSNPDLNKLAVGKRRVRIMWRKRPRVKK